MKTNRRSWFQQTAALSAAAALAVSHSTLVHAAEELLIIDTHQHLWDLSQLRLPWLASAPEVLRHDFRPQEYAEATRGYNVQAVYMEVDVDPAQHDQEAQYVIELARSGKTPTRAAVIGGRPQAADFAKYLDRHREGGFVKGVRQVLHGDKTPAGYCLAEDFVRGIRELGQRNLSFDLCMRPGELMDGAKLVDLCPDTRFVVDHCGNADPKSFRRGVTNPPHDPDAWRRSIEALAKRPHTICKISGIVASAPEGWEPEDLAPIVNHCLDSFGPDRVVFGGDWPVCLMGAKLAEWIEALKQIVATRSADEQQKLWSANARRFYGLA
jgi:predicted TIM-barrel fold metal-dependent hydrolase